MKKSRKLVIGLTFLTAAATAALATTVVGILKNQNLPTENKLELSKKKFGEKVNETKELIDKLLDPKYKDIRKKLQDALDETNKNITKDSKAEDYDKQVENLSKALEEVKKDKQQIDINDGSLDKSKKEYEKAKKSAEEFTSKLTDEKYKTVKDKLDKTIAEATKNINENSSKEDYKLATEKLNKAIEVANNEKTAIDNSNETLEDAINNFNNKLDEATNSVRELYDPEFILEWQELQKLIDEIEDEVVNASEEAKKQKELYQTGTAKLNEVIAKAKSLKLQRDFEYQEFDKLLEKLNGLIAKVDNKPYLTNLKTKLENYKANNFSDKNKLEYTRLPISELKNKIWTLKEAVNSWESRVNELLLYVAPYEDKHNEAQALAFELESKPEYSYIKGTLVQKISEAFDLVIKKPTHESFQNAIQILNDAISLAKKDKETKDRELVELEIAKNAYKAKKAEAEELIEELNTDTIYLNAEFKFKELSDDLSKLLNNIDSGLNDFSTKTDYENATTSLENAIQETKQAMREFKNQRQSLDEVKDAYKSQLKKAEDLSKELNKPEYKEIKEELDLKINEIKNGITDTSNKKDYQDATWKLEDLVKKIKEKAESKKNELDKLRAARDFYQQQLNQILQYKNQIDSDLKYSFLSIQLENEINRIKTSTDLENISSLEKGADDLYSLLSKTRIETFNRDNLWQQLLNEKALLDTLKQNVEGKDHLNSLKDKINTKLNELFPNNELTKQGQANNHDLELTLNELADSIKQFKEEFDLLEAKQNYLKQLSLVNEKLSEIEKSVNKEHYKESKDKLVSVKESADAIASGNTKISYDIATQELSRVLAEVIEKIKAIDQELSSPEGMERLYWAKLKEAKNYADVDLNSDQEIYSNEKDQLKQAIQAIENEVTTTPVEDQKKEGFFQDKIDKLNKALDQAKETKQEKDISLSEFDELALRANELDKRIDDSKYYSYYKNEFKWSIIDDFQPRSRKKFSSLTQDARKQKIDSLRNKVIYHEETLERVLPLISKYLDLKKEAEAFLQELSKNVIYNDIKIALEKQIFNSEEEIKNSRYIDYGVQIPILEEALELSKQDKKAIDMK
ncbi:coiled-coil domain-containing protein [Mycoplasmopsis arginini]|uniref:hypothetical protein n=1 Tax=Mycoplasmopsis arginini TaxID=2094 RepID=UPI000764A6EC|nr:hypothetical protein [Mycoplasmopsis arginini]